MAHKKIKTNIPRLRRMPERLFPDTVHIFTDGSCNMRDKSGGWGAVLMYNGNRKEIFGGKPGTTNNEMELTAILEGIKALKRRDLPVIIYSDSEYSVNALSVWHTSWAARGWITAGGTPVKNVELIKEIVKLAAGSVIFKWVKGHVGNIHNERADVLAGKGRRLHGYANKCCT